MNVRTIALVGAAIAAAAAPASAQIVKTQMKPVVQTDVAVCDKAVKDYISTVRFVRQASGAGIATSVEQKYIAEAELVQIAQRQGACAAADVLKAKGLKADAPRPG